MSEPQETVAPAVPAAEIPVAAAAATTAAVEPDAPIATQILAADENVCRPLAFSTPGDFD